MTPRAPGHPVHSDPAGRSNQVMREIAPVAFPLHAIDAIALAPEPPNQQEGPENAIAPHGITFRPALPPALRQQFGLAAE